MAVSTRRNSVPRATTPPGPVVAQVFVGWVQRSPFHRRHHRFVRHWRWDVTYYQCTSPHRDGVYDGRYHLSADVGYTFTEWGAWRRIRRSMHERTGELG